MKKQIPPEVVSLAEGLRNPQGGGLTVRNHVERFSRPLFVGLLFLTSACVHTQAPQTKGLQHTRSSLPITVQIMTSGDEQFAATLKSGVTKELRVLKNVEIVDASPKWRLRFNCASNGQPEKDTLSSKFQYLVSMVFSGVFHQGTSTEHNEAVLCHDAKILDSEGFDMYAKSVAANLDAEWFELVRIMEKERKSTPPKE
jgi:hypothetical protein